MDKTSEPQEIRAEAAINLRSHTHKKKKNSDFIISFAVLYITTTNMFLEGLFLTSQPPADGTPAVRTF